MDTVREKLQQMSKEELFEFMKQAGNHQKRALYDEMMFQIQDRDHSVGIHDTWGDRLQKKKDALEGMNNGERKLEQEL